MTKILVFRFSAMGDVIMCLPVLKGVLDAHKNVEIHLLTQKSFFPFFENIERLYLVEVDLKEKHRSFSGLYSLFQSLKKQISPDLVVDLHCVIRSYFLGFLFASIGRKLVRFRKGTLQKLAIVRSKRISPLTNTITRYADAFKSAGFSVSLPQVPLFSNNTSYLLNPELFKYPVTIGIAPFAKHAQKIWGIAKVDDLIGRINASYKVNVLLFGAGKSEMDQLSALEAKYSNCISSARYFKLADEIRLMKGLSLMVSMDSANMHLGAMAGIPTVSIWGATHPAFGFAPYQQPEENLIQFSGDDLKCRPCSVYGNRKCIYSDDIRCMRLITVDRVFERIKQILEPITTRIDT